MKRESKNKVYYPNLILVITGIAIILFSVYNIINLSLIKDQKATVLNTLENEYYVVGKDPTPYQKEVFQSLSDELNDKNRDYKQISELVAKSFVIDFFGWSNKDSAFDIGGLQYMKDPKSFNGVAHWEYYQKLDVFNSTYGKGQLPKVKDVRATTKTGEKIVLDDEQHDAYTVRLNWAYDQKGKLNINEFIKSALITLVEEDGKVSIVDIQMVEEVSTDE